MSVWYCIPSARPAEEAEPVLQQWRDRGYKIALWLDWDEYERRCDGRRSTVAEFVVSKGVYCGYAHAVNTLVGAVLKRDPDVEWIVTGGDDVLPDPNKSAEEIARECSEHFAHQAIHDKFPLVEEIYDLTEYADRMTTFGVMQPTGDRWHEGKGGFANAPIDRVCGSPWMGREFCRRMYGGKGPLFDGYRHMFVDEELQEVAIRLGVFWQRSDLTHFHRHWGRGATDSDIVNEPKIPAHLEKWNTQAHWRESKKLFEERKAAGFPGHEPL